MTTEDGIDLEWTASDPDTSAGLVWLIHGLGEHSGRYAHVIDRLNSAGFGVATLDLRGHGRSGGDPVHVKSYETFMTDLAQMFREVIVPLADGRPVIMLGHSMGGNLAMGYTLRHPDELAGLALSAPLLAPGSDIGGLQILAVKLIGRVAPGLGIDRLDSNSISRDPAVVAAYDDDPLVYHGKVKAGIAAALLGELETFEQRYERLDLPVLVLHGTADRLTNPDGSRALAAATIPAEVTAHFYDGAYHEIFNEPDRDTALDDLVTWLSDVIDAA